MEGPRFNSLGQPVGRSLEDWRAPVFPEPLRIVGRYCDLEPLDASRDASLLFDAFADDLTGANWTYLPYGPFESVDVFKRWLAERAASRDPQFYVIEPVGQDRPSGIASFLRITPESGSIELGHIHFAERMKRTPAATEALSLMIARAFELGYRRVEWKCDALNRPSRTAAQRLGFAYEGLFRQALVVKGRNRDTVWYSIIDSEWATLRAAHERWLSEGNFDSKGRQRVSLREWTRPILGLSGGLEPGT